MPFMNPARVESVLAPNLSEERYNTSPSSHIMRLIAALAGDAGVGAIRRKNLIGQLQSSLSTTRYTELDLLYGGTLGFPRRSSESYRYSPSGLLTQEQQDEIEAADASYRRRIVKFLSAIHLGTTVGGVRQIAEAVTDRRCHVIEDIDANTVSVFVVGQLAEERDENELLLSRILSRLIPRNVSLFIGGHPNPIDMSYLTADAQIRPVGATASSEGYTILRYVTGRSDSLSSSVDWWVERGVRKLAPTPIGSVVQTEMVNLTQMIDGVSASSVHAGEYGDIQRKYLPDATSPSPSIPDSAVSKAPRVPYSTSLYSDDEYAAYIYPLSYIRPERSPAGSSVWSSAEDSGVDEHIEFLFASGEGVPINMLSFNVSRKPASIRPLYLAPDGLWRPLTTLGGSTLTHEVRSFGFGMEQITLRCAPVLAMGIQIQFERRGDGEHYSVEVGGFEALFSIDSDSSLQFIASSPLEDVAGNIIEYEAGIRNATAAIDGDRVTCWVSKPNKNRMGVEHLVLDLGQVYSFSRLDIAPMVMGARFNIYVSSDSELTEQTDWLPVHGTYTLDGQPVEFVPTRGRFVKLEFFSLTPVPYDTAGGVREVVQLQYPVDVVASCVRRFGNGALRYVGSADFSGEARLMLASNSIPPAAPSLVPYDVMDAAGAYLVGMGGKRLIESDERTESQLGSYPVDVKFDNGAHRYESRRHYIDSGIAFVVGVRDVSVSTDDGLSTVRPRQTFFVDWSKHE